MPLGSIAFCSYLNRLINGRKREICQRTPIEIELDMNDMKTYLQDFLASVQRAEKERAHNPFIDETVDKFKVQLLEYRYLFGQFFYLLMNKNSESQQLRNQFLFVDQYFETIENHLSHLAPSWHR